MIQWNTFHISIHRHLLLARYFLCSQLQSFSKCITTKLREKSECCECCKEEVWLLFTETCVFALQWLAGFNIYQKQGNEALVPRKKSKRSKVAFFGMEFTFIAGCSTLGYIKLLTLFHLFSRPSIPFCWDPISFHAVKIKWEQYSAIINGVAVSVASIHPLNVFSAC